jgi:hypothetical protein
MSESLRKKVLETLIKVGKYTFDKGWFSVAELHEEFFGNERRGSVGKAIERLHKQGLLKRRHTSYKLKRWSDATADKVYLAYELTEYLNNLVDGEDHSNIHVYMDGVVLKPVYSENQELKGITISRQ